MQINPTSSVQATLAYNRQATQEQAKAATDAHKTFTPAPGLRPNIQDYIDINRTLIALRRL